MWRLPLVLTVGLILSAGVVLWGVAPASGQATTGPSPASLDAQELYRLDKYLNRTVPGRVMQGTPTTEVQANAARQVVTTSARTKLPMVAGAVRGGLAGVAAGVWIHNGIMIKRVVQCGSTVTCEEPAMYLDAEFREAGTSAGSAHGAGFASARTTGGCCAGPNSGTVVINSVVYAPLNSQDTTTTAKMNYSVYWEDPVINTTFDCPGSFNYWLHPATTNYTGACITVPGGTYERDIGRPPVAPGGLVMTADRANSAWSAPRTVVHATRGQAVTWTNPIYDVGAVEAEMETASAPLSTIQTSAQQGQDFYDKIRDQTCTPTAPPETTPEVCPDYFPEEWEEEYPVISDYPPDQGDPYGDPDGDDVPNVDDPDNDNDGVPDADDPAPQDPYNPKSWLDPEFRAPSDPQQREALWGPVVGTWTTPDGSECKAYEYGAQLCDSPYGSTFAWVMKDGVAWKQYQDGSKQWMARPGPRTPRAPPGPGDGSGSTTLYRVISQDELQDVQQFGDYHLSPHGGGKYFAVTEQGARNFANADFNQELELTLTSVEVPNAFLGNNGYYFDDIGQGGAGWSYHFRDEELGNMYEIMGPVAIMGRAN
jgi:hypothetical protein